VIECMIYTQTTKEKVIKPSQWKDDMYISLTWNDECPDPDEAIVPGTEYLLGEDIQLDEDDPDLENWYDE
jgi:hypothetical protein